MNGRPEDLPHDVQFDIVSTDNFIMLAPARLLFTLEHVAGEKTLGLFN